jgi:hypothetical protein
MRGRPAVPAIVLLFALTACNGSGDTPSPTARPGSGPSTGTVTPTPAADPDVVGLFRACHRTRAGSLILVFLFEDRDAERAADPANGFAVTSLDPTTWGASGAPVVVEPGYNEHVRQIEVPPDTPAPSEILLHVVVETSATGAALATNDVTVHVPSSSCATA